MRKYFAVVVGLLLLIGISPKAEGQPQYAPSGYNVMMKQELDGSKTSEFHAKFVNYINATDSWEKIDLTPRATANGFVMDKAPYTLELPKRANGSMRFVATNKWSVQENKIRNDAPIGKNREFIGADNVLGKVTSEGILYANAFPSIGADLLVQPHEEEARWLLKWNSKPVCIGTMEVSFRETFDPGITLLNEKGILDGTERKINRLVAKVNDFRGIGMKSTPTVWDSADNRMPVEIYGKIVGKEFIGRKIIPCSFFDSVTYPVYSDDTSTFNPAAGANSPVDGHLSRQGDDVSWASLIAATGTDVNATIANSKCSGYYATTTENQYGEVWKGGYLFNTASLGAVTINSATLGLRGTAKTSNIGAADVQVYSFNPASNSSLANGDILTFGTTAFSTAITIGAWSTSAYNNFALNASGIAAIETGITKFGTQMTTVVSGTPTWASDSLDYISAYYADQAGTTTDPLLTVNWSSATKIRSVIIIQNPFERLLAML